MPNAVVLLSGGIDSATTAAMVKERGFAIYALSFAYGQRHKVELVAAKRVAEALGVKRHIVQRVDLGIYGGSALTTDDIQVPFDRGTEQIGAGIPPTYVPARNTIFLAHALALAETVNAFNIFTGVSAVDYSGYPDCRPAFIEKYQELANLATAAAVEGKGTFAIGAPLIHMSKADIIRTGIRLGLDYGMTHSCYAPAADGIACGRCDSCLLRAKGFREAGVPDPTRYALR